MDYQMQTLYGYMIMTESR